DPNSDELQSPQTKHPLQRHREIASAFAVLRCKAASEKDRHAIRIVILLACSRLKLRDLRRSCRAVDAVGHDFDGRCKIRRSGSGLPNLGIAVAAAHLTPAPTRSRSRLAAVHAGKCCTVAFPRAGRYRECPPAPT